MAIKDVRNNLDKAVVAVSGKAKEIGVAAAGGAKEGIKIASHKAHDAQYELRMKMYNPLFPEQYNADDFDCPKIVVIEDEDIRKNIDVCQGAIGWLSKEAGFEVLHLYEEYVPESGLTFYPRIECENVYYLNPNQDERYINLNCYFQIMQQDKMTELKNIAFCLGAKECTLESYEVRSEVKTKKASAKKKTHVVVPETFETIEVESNVEGNVSSSKHSERRVLFSQKLEGSDSPVEPPLDWYKDDKEINSLIEMRLKGQNLNPMKEYCIKIDSKLSQTMDMNLAAKLDATMNKLKVSRNNSLFNESSSEASTKLEFIVRF